ncbi:prostate and testis expressed protein 13-like [Lepus europaeus]|uniref:prostate and testis expressed protein 13-like n=1 Tax=Lepus europaeus TaxID=9983 RepID=UPI002B4A2447|nr:prostate and testis expressed protein 13-like [Lepus europaeus]
MFRLFLLGIFIVLFIVIRFCNRCDHFDGAICHGGMKSCWKFNVYSTNKSCATNHYYYSDRFSGLYLFRYTTLNCKVCEEGMFQLLHDVLRETHCCTERDRCNDGRNNEEISRLVREEDIDTSFYLQTLYLSSVYDPIGKVREKSASDLGIRELGEAEEKGAASGAEPRQRDGAQALKAKIA